MRTNKIKLLLLWLMCFLLTENTKAQPNLIQPGGQITLLCECPDGPGWPWSWTSSSCNDATIVSQSMNTMNFMIADNTACCKIHWNAIGFCFPGVPNQCSEDVIVLPHLTAPASVNACGTFNVGVTTAGLPGGTNCSLDYGCPSPSITWTGDCGTCNLGTVNSYNNISVGSSISPRVINAMYNCDPQSPWSLNSVSVNVVLPSLTISGGPTTIGCSGTPVYPDNGNIQYNVNRPCGANVFSWNWPTANMSFVSQTVYSSYASIVLHVNGPGSGNVTVQAFNAVGGTIFSPVATKGVVVCCVPVINESTVLNSGNTGYQVEAFSTINSTNDMQSTGTATMHAGVEVHLLPGFNAKQGCQIHLYNASCNSGYMRPSTSQNEGDSVATSNGNELPANQIITAPLNSPVTYTMSRITKNNSTKNALSEVNLKSVFKVMPNPSTGKITIDFTGNSELPLEIAVVDALGSIIQRTQEIYSNLVTLDLSNFTDGIYAIRVSYKDRVESKSVIKNSK